MPRLLELFAGTGSVGRVFRARGWDVLSLDLDPKSAADLHMNVLDFNYRGYARDHFQCVHASPPCTHYSVARATAKTPRDLEASDVLVQRALDIAAHFAGAAFWMENPHSGLLKGRPVVAGRPYYVVDYCAYGRPFRKRTCLWSNVEGAEFQRCERRCGAWTGTGHAGTAQRRPGRTQALLGVADTWTLDELHALPEGLVEAMEEATRRWLAPQLPHELLDLPAGPRQDVLPAAEELQVLALGRSEGELHQQVAEAP